MAKIGKGGNLYLTLYVATVLRPICWKKYVELYAKRVPEKIWPAKHIQAISVRRLSGPLKQSKYDVPAVISFSRLSVCIIIASASFGSAKQDLL